MLLSEIKPINPEKRDGSLARNKKEVGLESVDNLSVSSILSLVKEREKDNISDVDKYRIAPNLRDEFKEYKGDIYVGLYHSRSSLPQELSISLYNNCPNVMDVSLVILSETNYDVVYKAYTPKNSPHLNNSDILLYRKEYSRYLPGSTDKPQVGEDIYAFLRLPNSAKDVETLGVNLWFYDDDYFEKLDSTKLFTSTTFEGEIKRLGLVPLKDGIIPLKYVDPKGSGLIVYESTDYEDEHDKWETEVTPILYDTEGNGEYQTDPTYDYPTINEVPFTGARTFKEKDTSVEGDEGVNLDYINTLRNITVPALHKGPHRLDPITSKPEAGTHYWDVLGTYDLAVPGDSLTVPAYFTDENFLDNSGVVQVSKYNNIEDLSSDPMELADRLQGFIDSFGDNNEVVPVGAFKTFCQAFMYYLGRTQEQVNIYFKFASDKFTLLDSKFEDDSENEDKIIFSDQIDQKEKISYQEKKFEILGYKYSSEGEKIPLDSEAKFGYTIYKLTAKDTWEELPKHRNLSMAGQKVNDEFWIETPNEAEDDASEEIIQNYFYVRPTPNFDTSARRYRIEIYLDEDGFRDTKLNYYFYQFPGAEQEVRYGFVVRTLEKGRQTANSDDIFYPVFGKQNRATITIPKYPYFGGEYSYDIYPAKRVTNSDGSTTVEFLSSTTTPSFDGKSEYHPNSNSEYSDFLTLSSGISQETDGIYHYFVDTKVIENGDPDPQNIFLAQYDLESIGDQENPEKITLRMKFSQELPPVELEIDPYGEYAVPYEENKVIVNVLSNTIWNVAIDDEGEGYANSKNWISIENSIDGVYTSSGNGTFTLNIFENPTTEVRKGRITVSNVFSNETRELIICQSATDTKFTIKDTKSGQVISRKWTIEINEKANSKICDLSIDTNSYWVLTGMSKDSWLTAYPSSTDQSNPYQPNTKYGRTSSDSYPLVLAATALGKDKISRSETITISSENNAETYEITVIQKNTTYAITPSSKTLVFNYSETSASQKRSADFLLEGAFLSSLNWRFYNYVYENGAFERKEVSTIDFYFIIEIEVSDSGYSNGEFTVKVVPNNSTANSSGKSHLGEVEFFVNERPDQCLSTLTLFQDTRVDYNIDPASLEFNYGETINPLPTHLSTNLDSWRISKSSDQFSVRIQGQEIGVEGSIIKSLDLWVHPVPYIDGFDESFTVIFSNFDIDQEGNTSTKTYHKTVNVFQEAGQKINSLSPSEGNFYFEYNETVDSGSEKHFYINYELYEPAIISGKSPWISLRDENGDQVTTIPAGTGNLDLYIAPNVENSDSDYDRTSYFSFNTESGTQLTQLSVTQGKAPEPEEKRFIVDGKTSDFTKTIYWEEYNDGYFSEEISFDIEVITDYPYIKIQDELKNILVESVIYGDGSTALVGEGIINMSGNTSVILKLKMSLTDSKDHGQLIFDALDSDKVIRSAYNGTIYYNNFKFSLPDKIYFNYLGGTETRQVISTRDWSFVSGFDPESGITVNVDGNTATISSIIGTLLTITKQKTSEDEYTLTFEMEENQETFTRTAKINLEFYSIPSPGTKLSFGDEFPPPILEVEQSVAPLYRVITPFEVYVANEQHPDGDLDIIEDNGTIRISASGQKAHYGDYPIPVLQEGVAKSFVIYLDPTDEISTYSVGYPSSGRYKFMSGEGDQDLTVEPKEFISDESEIRSNSLIKVICPENLEEVPETDSFYIYGYNESGDIVHKSKIILEQERSYILNVTSELTNEESYEISQLVSVNEIVTSSTSKIEPYKSEETKTSAAVTTKFWYDPEIKGRDTLHLELNANSDSYHFTAWENGSNEAIRRIENLMTPGTYNIVASYETYYLESSQSPVYECAGLQDGDFMISAGIQTNYEILEYSCDQSWIHFTEGGSNFSIDENTALSDRSAVVTVQGKNSSGKETESILITIGQKSRNYFTIWRGNTIQDAVGYRAIEDTSYQITEANPLQFNRDGVAEGNTTIWIYLENFEGSNPTYTKEDWIKSVTIGKVDGEDKWYYCSVTADLNSIPSVRTGSITLTFNGVTEVIPVSQEAGIQKYWVRFYDHTEVLLIEEEVPSGTTYHLDEKATIPNRDGYEPLGWKDMDSEETYDISRTLTINKDFNLKASYTEIVKVLEFESPIGDITLKGAETAPYTVKVISSNVSWDVELSNSTNFTWQKLSDGSGFTVKATGYNYSSNSYTSTITLKSTDGSIVKTKTITQDKIRRELEVPNSITVSADGGDALISVKVKSDSDLSGQTGFTFEITRGTNHVWIDDKIAYVSSDFKLDSSDSNYPYVYETTVTVSIGEYDGSDTRSGSITIRCLHNSSVFASRTVTIYQKAPESGGEDYYDYDLFLASETPWASESNSRSSIYSLLDDIDESDEEENS